MRKEILNPVYFDKDHNLKIKDLTVYNKYRNILLTAIKS